MSISLQKISLKKPGEFAEIPLHDLVCTLSWTSPVDLDFFAYYQPKKTKQEKKGFFGKLLGSVDSEEGVVYYGNKGSSNSFPYIQLDKDAGIGDVGGANQENLRFFKIDEHEHILIVANIFNKRNANFASYDGKVTLKVDKNGHGNGQEFEVPLTATEGGSYCVIARIDNSTGTPRLINVNKTMNNEPLIKDFI